MNTHSHTPQEQYIKQFNLGKGNKRKCFKLLHILQYNFDHNIYDLPPNQIEGCPVSTLIDMSTTKGPTPHKLPFGLSAIYDMKAKGCESNSDDNKRTDQDINGITSTFFGNDSSGSEMNNLGTVSIFKPKIPLDTHWHSSKRETEELDGEQWYNIPFYEEECTNVRGYIFGIHSCANVALLYLYCNLELEIKNKDAKTKAKSDKPKAGDINCPRNSQNQEPKKRGKNKAQQGQDTNPSKKQKKTNKKQDATQNHQLASASSIDMPYQQLSPLLYLDDDNDENQGSIGASFDGSKANPNPDNNILSKNIESDHLDQDDLYINFLLAEQENSFSSHTTSVWINQ